MRLTIEPRNFVLGIAVCLIVSNPIKPQTPQTDGSYEAAIASLAKISDAQRVSKAIAMLNGAGTKAFPALLAHLNDATTASDVFQRAVQHIHGNVPSPTIGEACFDLIQGQIEGNWPKGFRQYYVLSATNVARWWQARKEKSLRELRIEVARTSLTRARQSRGTSSYWPEAVRFLEKHLREAQAGRNDW